MNSASEETSTPGGELGRSAASAVSSRSSGRSSTSPPLEPGCSGGSWGPSTSNGDYCPRSLPIESIKRRCTARWDSIRYRAAKAADGRIWWKPKDRGSTRLPAAPIRPRSLAGHPNSRATLAPRDTWAVGMVEAYRFYRFTRLRAARPRCLVPVPASPLELRLDQAGQGWEAGEVLPGHVLVGELYSVELVDVLGQLLLAE